MSDRIELVELNEVREAIGTYAPLMSDGMLDKIIRSVGMRKRTFTKDDDRLMGLAALWLAPHEDRVRAKEWFLEVLGNVWVEVERKET